MGIRTPLFQPQMPPVHPKCRLPSHDNGQVFKWQKIGAFSTLCGRRKREGERGREKSTKAGKRKGSACYKSWCFCITHTINFSKLLRQHQLPMHDQSQLGGFSPWSDLNITLFTGNCQVETLFSSDIIFERNKTFFTVLAPTANMTTRLQAVSLFLLLAVYYKQWSISCEYTWPSVLPHQAQWSQRTEQLPAWDANNDRRIINNYQKAQWIVFTKALTLSVQTI